MADGQSHHLWTAVDPMFDATYRLRAVMQPSVTISITTRKPVIIISKIANPGTTKAEKVFAAIGLSATDAIGMFYRQVVFRKGLPFDVCVPNAVTLAALQETESGGGEVVQATTEGLFEDILSEK